MVELMEQHSFDIYRRLPYEIESMTSPSSYLSPFSNSHALVKFLLTYKFQLLIVILVSRTSFVRIMSPLDTPTVSSAYTLIFHSNVDVKILYYLQHGDIPCNSHATSYRVVQSPLTTRMHSLLISCDARLYMPFLAHWLICFTASAEIQQQSAICILMLDG